MTYHEAFWGATAAAAPIIALAAVAQDPGAGSWATLTLTLKPAWWVWLKPDDEDSDDEDSAARLKSTIFAIRVLTISNVIAQAALLAVSLSALAAAQNVVPPWVAIVGAVGGILLLAYTLIRSANVRKSLERLGDRVRQHDE